MRLRPPAMLNLLTAASLALALAAAAFWARSYSSSDLWSRPPLWVGQAAGMVTLAAGHSPWASVEYKVVWHHGVGNFSLSRDRLMPGGDRLKVRFPHAAAVLVSGALPLVRAWRWRLGRRRQPGTCAECGYDLRVTPGRCPECGTAAVARPAG